MITIIYILLEVVIPTYKIEKVKNLDKQNNNRRLYEKENINSSI